MEKRAMAKEWKPPRFRFSVRGQRQFVLDQVSGIEYGPLESFGEAQELIKQIEVYGAEVRTATSHTSNGN